MDIRDMNGDPRIWEGLYWEDMSAKEQELWTLLGWQQDRWNRNEAPESTNKAWNDLTYREQSAAMKLGFSEEIWDNFEDE